MKIPQYKVKRGAKFVLGGGTRIFSNKREIKYEEILEDEENEFWLDWLEKEEENKKEEGNDD